MSFQKIMTRCRGRLDARILFYKPADAPPGWELTDSWRDAERIPGVRVAVDPDGAEAARFGVETSGHALLYDPAGQLLFSGGLTAARGHAGDNPGRSAVVALVMGGTPEVRRTSVFGCPLSAAGADPR